jgi:L-threonylcarbamoyladenylate synthase
VARLIATPFRTDGDIEAAIPAAAAHIRDGGLLAYPTETLYGLGGAVNPPAIEALARLKGRPADKPFLVLISGVAMLGMAGVRLDGRAAALADRYWPGPLTLVLPVLAKGRVSPTAAAGTKGLAVRWTSHGGMARLIQAYGEPITSTSANLSGVPPATTVEEIARQWETAIARGELCLLDGGPLTDRSPSTVVDCTGPVPRVTRRGALTTDALREAVPELVCHE